MCKVVNKYQVYLSMTDLIPEWWDKNQYSINPFVLQIIFIVSKTGLYNLVQYGEKFDG